MYQEQCTNDKMYQEKRVKMYQEQRIKMYQEQMKLSRTHGV